MSAGIIFLIIGVVVLVAIAIGIVIYSLTKNKKDMDK
jgi:cytochrome c-type biogenesis protein CcmE